MFLLKKKTIYILISLINASIVLPLYLSCGFLFEFLQNFEEVYFTEKEGIFNFSYVYGGWIFFIVFSICLTVQIFIWSFVLLNRLWPQH